MDFQRDNNPKHTAKVTRRRTCTTLGNWRRFAKRSWLKLNNNTAKKQITSSCRFQKVVIANNSFAQIKSWYFVVSEYLNFFYPRFKVSFSSGSPSPYCVAAEARDRKIFRERILHFSFFFFFLHCFSVNLKGSTRGMREGKKERKRKWTQCFLVLANKFRECKCWKMKAHS